MNTTYHWLFSTSLVLELLQCSFTGSPFVHPLSTYGPVLLDEYNIEAFQLPDGNTQELVLFIVVEVLVVSLNYVLWFGAALTSPIFIAVGRSHVD